MHQDIPEDWLHPPDLARARQVQREMAARVVREDAFGPVQRLGGADTSLDRFDPAQRIFAALVTLDPAGEGTGVESQAAVLRAPMPYVPGFLGFREVPVLVEAWRRLERKPDLVMVDGHGASHPRGLGVACHLGVALDVPTIGVAKSRLFGHPDGELGPEPGDRVNLVHEGQVLAVVLRTRRRSNPVYVSVGHRISLGSAVEWVQRGLRGYRLPEATRQAHLAANAARLALGMHAEKPGPATEGRAT
ncbi:Endonuclease V [Roseomonas mucosa]|uniref:Endonuclease V n=1 Tax=Roseomonas mucosa TaxID=207340 RepID=A0A4Y1MT14_9PROT|nr:MULTISPECIES: deoxyribonuclease V [Roseomonas]ATR22056.1 deoxyribonuclease V [Roseomonas sp. FDAARGOS_362]AWV21165.1 Endonuclease V [Roseomonas mucosa]MDT8276506.1 deoxyribonuclease V [Roseomonas mucosa]MDT8352687.1 deoxyribonuclease V [Roseomonas mucosa]QDJ08074.1 Endonuclease V [Roseomonas mucosa]